MNQTSRDMPPMMFRILFVMAAVAVAAGGFALGASSYELDRSAAMHHVPGLPPLPPLGRR
jgi:hypothetical protein